MHPWPELPRPVGMRRRLTLAWLCLALGALAVSTLFALLLVISRTPLVAHSLSPDFFAGALVMHVNLAVTVWFLAFAAVWWTLTGPAGGWRLAWSGWGLSVAGVCALLLARLAGEHRPVLSNYVPVIDGPVFLAGLTLFFAGIGLVAWRILYARGEGLAAGARLAAVIALLALGVMAGTALLLPDASDYENLFWGGGHLLQFTHTLLLIAAWQVLAGRAGVPAPRLRPAAIFVLAAIPALFAPLILFFVPAGSESWRHAWTEVMRWGSWPVAVGFGLWLALAMRCHPAPAAVAWRAALWLSLCLFAAGLLAGALIREDNVMVTAHYHGTVGAITLAFMAVTHHLLERLGLRPTPVRRLRRQFQLYGGGLLLLILGLFWSGLHGVQRKTPGAAMLDPVQAWGGMLLMGIGGFIGLAATVWFLWLVLRPLWPAVAGAEPATRVEKAG